jgi:hypothetical protein
MFIARDTVHRSHSFRSVMSAVLDNKPRAMRVKEDRRHGTPGGVRDFCGPPPINIAP